MVKNIVKLHFGAIRNGCYREMAAYIAVRAGCSVH